MSQSTLSTFQEIAKMGFADWSIKFFMDSQFWYWHGLFLTINWFGIAFIAIIVKQKYHTLWAKLIHTLLFLICNLTTFFVNIGAMYRTYVNWHRFPKWSILNKSHKLAGTVFTIFLVFQILGGLTSFIGYGNWMHRKYGYALTYFAMLITISGLVLQKFYMKGAIFAIISLVEYVILQGINTKALFDNPSKRKSSQEYKKLT